MQSVLEYRVDDLTEQLKAQRDNSHKVNTVLLKQSATLDKIMEAADRTFEKACENSERVDTIEKRIAHDDAVKETKSKIIKGFFEHWKVFIFAAFVIFDLMVHTANAVDAGKMPYFLSALKNL